MSDIAGTSPVITIRGERIALGSVQREMIPALHRWFNHMPTDRTQGDLPGPRTLERVTAWYERMAAGVKDTTCLAIYELASGQPIGIVWLSDIDFRHRTAGKRAYEKAGFSVIGRRRESYRFTGQAYDEIMMEAVAG